MTTTSKPRYSMSEVGACPRTLSAIRLGYDSLPAPQFLETAAREGDRHEALIVEDLEALGWWVSVAVRCEECGRNGEHLEMTFPAFNLVGHIDRRVVLDNDNTVRFAEFKALGRWRAESLCRALEQGDLGDAFHQYKVQVSLYYYATGLPCIYAVKNRDTGLLRWFHYNSFIPLEDIVDRVLGVELAARKNNLAGCELGETEFWYRNCPFAYLHKEDERSPQEQAAERGSLPSLVAAYLEGKRLQSEGQAMIDGVKKELTEAARKPGFLRVEMEDGSSGVVKYVKGGKQTSYDRKLLEQRVDQVVLEECKKTTARNAYVTVEREE